MGVAAQHIRAGKLEPEWKKELARLAEIRAIERIWKKDASLWKTDEAHGKVIRNRLGWLNPNVMSQQAAEVAQFAQQTYADGFRDIVLLGMGGSSLAPEVFSLVFPSTLRFQKFWVIDSTDPASLKAVEKNSDLRKCLFIVASKS
ncbi:MAG: transaldolase, partial [Acidobacteria bacterium]|nr:transaldolase [Acidobacteriota bacterium]